jgi:hypothetical protein
MIEGQGVVAIHRGWENIKGGAQSGGVSLTLVAFAGPRVALAGVGEGVRAGIGEGTDSSPEPCSEAS